MKRIAFSGLLLILVLQTSISLGQALSGTKTVGSGATYTNLTAAIAAATTNGVSGPVIFELTSGYSSSGESFPIAIGPISGVSATNTITIRPSSGATGLSITSANATATIDLNGATYVTIDGRPGGTGSKNLSITNSNTSGVAIRWINDACFNTVKYSVLSGQNVNPTGGVIFFSGTNVIRGNDSNTVDNCDIRDDNGNTPTTAVYASGNATGTVPNNSNNFITNNNIFNFWNNSASEVNAFKVSAGNTDWIITGNSMYQTSSRSPSSAFQLYFFNMNNSSANNHIMDNNFLGGTAPQCGGTAFTVNAAVGFRITGCYLNTASTVPSSWSGNTMTNFDITSGTASYPGIPGVFSGPWLVGGLFIINNNTFGSMNGNTSIKVTSGVNGSCVYPIGATGTTGGNQIIKGNKFGSIDVAGTTSSISTSLNCISIATSGSSVTYVIDSNTIGNTLPDNLIASTATTSSTAQTVIGIYNASATCNINARGNTIRNMSNAAIGSGTSISYFTHGIDIGAGGTDTITGNTIYNLNNSALYQNNNSGSAAVTGIRCVMSTLGNVCSGNTIYGLNQVNTGAATVNTIGIVTNSMISSRIDRNLIHSLTTAASGTGGSIQGINIQGGSPRVFNNMIRLGTDTLNNSITSTPTIQGIFKLTGNLSLFHNSILINGSGVGSNASNTYAYQSAATGTDSVYNNIFGNERSNSTSGGTHFSVGLAGSTGLIQDYNNFWFNGTGGAAGQLGANAISSLSTWASSAGVDANSFSNTPGFKTPNGTYKTLDLHISTSTNKGTPNANVQFDVDNDIRSNPPDLGADEIPYDIGVLTIDSPTNVTFCGKSRNVWITFKNFSQFAVTSAIFNVIINGTLTGQYNWTGNLAAGATSSSFNIGSYNFTSGNYSLSINSRQPNNKTDNNNTNDTAKVSFSVIPTVIATVAISTPLNPVCQNASVTFKANFTNGGSSPVFTWKKNGVTVGTNDSIYTSATLSNSDSVWVVMTSNAACPNPVSPQSNVITMTVGSSLVPSVTISGSSTNVCPGTPINFKATSVNGGLTPHYQWLKNGNPVGTDSIGYLLTSPQNNDAIKCVLFSSLSCASKASDTSASTSVTVFPLLTPSATISASSTSICSGSNDTFTAVLSNGGNNPVYQWKKNNGVSLGSTPTMIINSLSNGDSVYLTITSNAQCASPTTVNSNKIPISVVTAVTPAVTVNASKTSLCTGDSVQFTANVSNGGSNPGLIWYKNQSVFTSNTTTFSTTNIQNKDTVYLVLTSNAQCLTKTSVTSANLIFTVNQSVTPTISLSSSGNSICSGAPVQFTATITNGGSSPHFFWKKNGGSFGTDSANLTTNLLQNKDSIWVIMTSNAPCATKSSDTSIKMVITATPTVTPTITLNQTSPVSFCPGSAVTLSATITNGGSTPHYQWMKNSQLIGNDSLSISHSNFADKDTVWAVLISNATCATSTNVKSGKILMFMFPPANTAVSITESANNICLGANVTFTAAPVNGGTTPIYQWLINGSPAGTNASTFATSALVNKDTVTVRMTSNANCASPLTATSNKIGMSVKPLITPKVSVTSNINDICPGGVIVFTAADSNGGTAPKHAWFRQGVQIGTDSIKLTYAFNSGGPLMCVLTSNIACPARTKDTAYFDVRVKPLPAKPIITRDMDTLFSTVSQSYQWLLNNNPLSGATNRTLVALQNGIYKVTVDSNGCKNTSDIYNFIYLTLDQTEAKSRFTLYPNPARNVVYLSADFQSSAHTIIQITDITGRVITSTELADLHVLHQFPMQLNNLQSGTYYINIKHGDDWLSRPLIIE